ncbi:hypothetical protein [Flavobacterium oreochromis]|uniref:Lipoprotein n=1 Tax=Flavobacterium columnare TaxID=996 RepID=A0A246G9H2_9FLAO|nr:hypothetical protein [Flavobacterium oreochromis]OWP74407.1 hypothetical protein BWK62_14440 [Flavobacterium oreochromis]
MKKMIFIFVTSTILSSCYHEWVLRPEIKGRVLNKQNKPVNAKIATLSIEGEDSELAINIGDGKFYFSKQTIKKWTFLGMEKPKGPPTTNKIIIYATGYRLDTLDYTNYNSNESVIDLGNIILEKKL